MKEVRYSTKAKKDLKKYRNDLAKMHDLFVVLRTLASGGTLDARYRAHMLTGNYKDCMECHVGNDFPSRVDRYRRHICGTCWKSF